MIKYICAALTVTFLTYTSAFASAEQNAEATPKQVAPVKGPRERLTELDIELGLERENNGRLYRQLSQDLKQVPSSDHPYSKSCDKVYDLLQQRKLLKRQIAQEER